MTYARFDGTRSVALRPGIELCKTWEEMTGRGRYCRDGPFPFGVFVEQQK